jgi:hypothetical protein
MENCYKHLKSGGTMIVDDYKSGPPRGCSIKDVDKAVEEFSKNHNISFETIKLSDGKGMAIFRKK